MATINTTALQCGHDYEFINEPPDDLKCLICLHVARNPQQHGDGGCGKIFCTNCISKYKRTNINCPYCGKIITTFKDERSERDIQSLKVKCISYQDGCQWVGELRGIDKHLMTCDFVIVKCPNKCEETRRDYGVQVTQLFRKDLENHVTKMCQRRQYNCRHCKECGEYKYVTSKEHTDICPKIIILCPNAPNCKNIFPRHYKHTHLFTCRYQKISCKYNELGCRKRPFRKDLSEHENNDDKAHLHDAMTTVLSLKKQCRFNVLKTQVDTNGKPIALKFKMSQFTEKKEHSSKFLSDSFYTHPKGYKLTICVDANGSKKFKGTHISVFVYIMKGEYDDQLEFPFKGTITFELLNQLEDDNHHSKSFKHDGTLESSKRVMHHDRSSEAHGIPDFISHENLDYDAFKNCQYLIDDCLVFRISVNIPSYKPWLQCP